VDLSGQKGGGGTETGTAKTEEADISSLEDSIIPRDYAGGVCRSQKVWRLPGKKERSRSEHEGGDERLLSRIAN